MSRPLSGSGSGWARTALRGMVRTLTAGLVAATCLSLSVGLGPAGSASARGTNPATPGDFTGYGFDQCETPSQSSMNQWRRHSPFWPVGIYIAGDERDGR